MAYPNRLGEFVVSQDDNWPTTIQWKEQPPITGKGSYNPWAQERQRVVWMQEKAAWAKIVPLQKEYRSIEKRMADDINTFNSHLAELERVAGKKVGLGPIGQYGGMALAILPGFGWATAALSAISMVFEMIGGNKKKKRINQLVGIMDAAQARLHQGKQRLQDIQEELRHLIGATERAKEENRVRLAQDQANQQVLQSAKESRERQSASSFQAETARIRQLNQNRVYSLPQDL